MARVEELTDIPSDQVEDVISDFNSEGAQVEKISQPDGNWTVRATFSD